MIQLSYGQASTAETYAVTEEATGTFSEDSVDARAVFVDQSVSQILPELVGV